MWTLVWKVFVLNCLFGWPVFCAVCVGLLSTMCHGIADALGELSWMSLLSLATGALAWGLCGVSKGGPPIAAEPPSPLSTFRNYQWMRKLPNC